MFLSLPLLVLALPSNEPAPSTVAQDRRAEVKARYEELAAARDAKGLGELWMANRTLILQTIDADLEGGLALWEQSPAAPELEKIAALHERALFGAEAASAATGQPIFADYASSFAGWDDEEKRSFRTGQALHAASLEEAKAGNWNVAHTKAIECRERAISLGDWWGTAMGYAAEAGALRGGGQLAEALVAYSQARLVYHDLDLSRNEYQAVHGMAAMCRALERPGRAHVAASDGIAMARAMSDAAGELELLRVRLWAEQSLGMTEAAEATKAEIAAHGKAR